MFESPKRAALVTALGGLGFGILLTTATKGQDFTLTTLLFSLLIGMVLGGVVFVCWQRNKSASFLISWFLVIYFAVSVSGVLGLGREAAYAAGGYGLILWVGIYTWEQRHKSRVSWQDSESDQKE